MSAPETLDKIDEVLSEWETDTILETLFPANFVGEDEEMVLNLRFPREDTPFRIPHGPLMIPHGPLMFDATPHDSRVCPAGGCDEIPKLDIGWNYVHRLRDGDDEVWDYAGFISYRTNGLMAYALRTGDLSLILDHRDAVRAYRMVREEEKYLEAVSQP